MEKIKGTILAILSLVLSYLFLHFTYIAVDSEFKLNNGTSIMLLLAFWIVIFGIIGTITGFIKRN